MIRIVQQCDVTVADLQTGNFVGGVAKRNETLVKICVLGPWGVGKTALLCRFCLNNPPRHSLSPQFDNWPAPGRLLVGNEVVSITVLDSSSAEDMARLRSLSLRFSHTFLLCFAIDRPESVSRLDAFLAEVQQHCPGAPFVVAACKCDLRDDLAVVERLAQRGLALVSSAEGAAAATRLGAAGYVECSAETGDGVREAFLQTVRAALANGRGERLHPQTAEACWLI